MRTFPVQMPSGMRYWTVIGEDLLVMSVPDAYLRYLRFGRDAAESTTKTYAGAVALYLSWCAAPAATTSPGSNASNENGFSAATGYLTGTADTASTLTHLGARDYDAVLGIFTGPDPILNPADAKNFSPYAYSEHDPINQTDPSGLKPTCDCDDDNTGKYAKSRYGYGTPDDIAPPPTVWYLKPAPAPAPGRLPVRFPGRPSTSWLLQDRSITPGSLGADPTVAIGLFALGYGNWGGDLKYGRDSTYLKTIKQRPETKSARSKILQQLANGNGTPDPQSANYESGTPGLGNPNFVRDACTFALWASACFGLGSRELAATGSYSLKMTVENYDPVYRQARIVYEGENFMTLGSAFGFTPEARAWLNNLELPHGLAGKQRQTFQERELVTW